MEKIAARNFNTNYYYLWEIIFLFVRDAWLWLCQGPLPHWWETLLWRISSMFLHDFVEKKNPKQQNSAAYLWASFPALLTACHQPAIVLQTRLFPWEKKGHTLQSLFYNEAPEQKTRIHNAENRESHFHEFSLPTESVSLSRSQGHLHSVRPSVKASPFIKSDRE